MSYTDSIFLYAPPFISILKVQESLELRTGVPVKSQLFIHAKTDLSLSASTLRKSNIEKQDTRLAFYDMRNFIEISVRTSFQLGTEPLIFKVRPDMRIRDFQKQLETATEILIAEQLISHNDINQTLSWQTFWQLEIFTGAEFLLGNKDDIIEIKIHKNGDVEDHLSMQHQTIRILILAYLSPRPDNSIPFLCRPTADGSPARYENALDENKMLMDLGIRSGDMLCAGTISKDEI
ncbi:hypothetical protein MMC31_005596 [Peltigera leucophlebia]|nr:hypothetical protein [Peltigera leucophlebia]